MSDSAVTPDAWHERGVTAARAGDFATAVAHIEQAIAQNPDEPLYYSNLGSVLHLMGEYERAAAAHQRALELGRQRMAWYQYNLATALAAGGRASRAESAYTRALEHDPRFVLAHVNLGTLWQGQGRMAEAESAYRRAVELAPHDPLARRNLGSVLAATGRVDEAAAAYRRAAEIAPEDPTACRELGELLTGAGRYQEAAEAFGQAAARAPEDAAAHNGLGATLAALGRAREATQALERAVACARASRPDWAQPHYNLGVVLHRAGSLDRAEAAYRDALARAPDDARALANLADCLRRLERYDEARAAYADILARDPSDPTARHLFAALGGDTPAQPPEGYVQTVFDDYAPRFDQHLVDQLGYRVPKEMRAAIEEVAGRAGALRVARALDLGCGTGLVGQEVRALCGVLHGVDLAPRMLEVARQKGLYEALFEREACAFLADPTAGEAAYELITAADVLIYIGALEGLFAGVRARLTGGGWFAFTTEELGEEASEESAASDMTLAPTGRFAHGRGYIERLARDHGLTERLARPVDLRKEHDRIERGVLYVLERIRDMG